MRASPAPATGAQAEASTVGVSGDSGTLVTDHAASAPLPAARARASQQPVGVEVEAGEGTLVGVGPGAPGLGQRAGEVVLLGQEVGGPVAHAAGLDAAAPGRRRGSRSVSRRSSGVSHGSHDSMPSKTRPSLSRSHCSRPHGSSATSAAARARTSARGQELAGREDRHLVEVGGGALVVDRELAEPVDLVAPQVDADRRVGRSTGTRRRSSRGGPPRPGARPAPRGGSPCRRAARPGRRDRARRPWWR